ncbi:hypothetical protein LCGC14_0262930 [marine sediment metagenome]|uniref:Uncharacterized protein n=1 Tax=marine sediment metagenome TaxID=412755 RepID=A0A0F9U5Y8_9ZZZZ
MVRLPKLPDPLDLENVFSVIDQAGNALDKGLGVIDRIADKFDRAAEKFDPGAPTSKTPLSAPESPKKPPSSPPEASTLESSAATGTACLPCSRDHFLTSSSSLSEGIRFAREKGVRDREVMRRIRIALQELDIMERIDLAPEETAKLKGAEKELANWTLKQSREIRHAITAIKDVESMEQAAAKASEITEEFMTRLWAIPEEECKTCSEIRESISQFIEKRKRERAKL